MYIRGAVVLYQIADRDMCMKRWSELTVSAASLLVGIMSIPHIGEVIQKVTKAFGWPSEGVVPALLWLVVYLLLCAVVFFVVLPVISFFEWLLVEKRSHEKKREERRGLLRKLLDTADDILSQLNVMADELRRENLFDQSAEERLMESAAKSDMIIGMAVTGALRVGAHVHVPEFSTLLTSITRHSGAEIVSVFSPSVPHTKDKTKTKVIESGCGVKCVRMLVKQLQEDVRTSPDFAGQPVAASYSDSENQGR